MESVRHTLINILIYSNNILFQARWSTWKDSLHLIKQLTTYVAQLILKLISPKL